MDDSYIVTKMLSEWILTSRYLAARGVLTTDFLILNHGQMVKTIPELATPSSNFHSSPKGGHLIFYSTWPPLHCGSSAVERLNS
ncbi:hypothetical protein TNCV_4479921 [Trichonephila clavipes]|nr:hypothetical protein TNCV_4479921 [Trichonephila clavipes]